MACGGCSGAIERVLNKTDGILPPFLSLPPVLSVLTRPTSGLTSIDVSLEKQLVTVSASSEGPSYDDVYEKIKKTGKEIISGEIISEEQTKKTEKEIISGEQTSN